jgi:hypothetical protein
MCPDLRRFDNTGVMVWKENQNDENDDEISRDVVMRTNLAGADLGTGMHMPATLQGR